MTRPSLQHRVTRVDYALHNGGVWKSDPTLIVMHTTVGGSARSSIDYMNTTKDKKASYNYLIERDGEMLRMTKFVAYHAGDSAWPNPKRATAANPNRPNGGKSVNGISIGIAWANLSGPLTDEQIASGLWLVATFCEMYSIPVDRVVGHAQTSPGRKSDPELAIKMDDFRDMLTSYMQGEA